ncbi:MAG: hypothetical protein ABFD76_02435 [Smithella sp.]
MAEPYKIIYNYADVPTIARFAQSNKRIRGLMGPFGSGKSSGCLMEIIKRAHEQAPSQDGIRRSRWAVVRNTFRMLNDTTIRTVMDWMPESVFGEYSVTNHNYVITKMPGVHIELMFRALDRPEHVSNLLSMELTGAWINEAREIPWEIVEALDGRINRFPGKKDGGCTWCGIIMDTNPPGENSEWYDYFEKKKPSNAEIFKQPSGLSSLAENLPNLAKDYYKTLAIGKNDQYVRVYIEGKYGYMQEGKLVIEQFNDNVHIALSIIRPMEDRPLICGMDFGLNPSLLLGQITPRGKLLIIDEFVSDKMGLEQFMNNVFLPQMRMNYFGVALQGGYGDPSGINRSQTDESTCYEVLRDIGFEQILPCPTNALIPRVAAVESFLTKMIDGEPGVVISPKCVMLRKGLNGGYHRQRIAGTTNEYSDQPFKNIYSHICLSGDTKILTSEGEKTIKEITTNDFVVTPFGLRKVLASGITKKNTEVIKIKLSNGRELVCTKDHELILFNKSIVKCNTLEYNDVLQTYESWRTLKWSIQSLLSSMARNTGFRQAITTERKIGEREGQAIFTGLFWNIITNAKFLKDMTFTILMEMFLIMTSRILNLSTAQTTPDITCLKESKMGLWTTLNLWRWHEKPQSHGMGQRMELSFIKILGKNLGKIRNILSSNVNIVEKNYEHHSRAEKDSVESTAKQEPDTIPEKMTFKDRVLFVVKTLQRINILKLKPAPKVVKVSLNQELEDVYNITVDVDHVYYANGILVCNCEALEYLCYYVNDLRDANKKNDEILKRIGPQRKRGPAVPLVGL